MTTVAITALDATSRDAGPRTVSWPAIIAGAAGAAALSLILLVLGTGLGLAVVSPWAGEGVSAGALGWSGILWLAVMAVAASGLGGYLAGRLRTRWQGVHGDEVYFRDTAHGFLAWAVATLLTAATLTTVIGTVLGTGTLAAAAASDGGKAGDVQSMYRVDALFRRPALQPGSETVYVNATPEMRQEMSRILFNGLAAGSLSPEDSRYAAQLVAVSTGVSQADAQARVSQAYTEAKAAADEARKNAAYAALWLFISLLLGAFTASYTATLGGRRRDLFWISREEPDMRSILLLLLGIPLPIVILIAVLT